MKKNKNDNVMVAVEEKSGDYHDNIQTFMAPHQITYFSMDQCWIDIHKAMQKVRLKIQTGFLKWNKACFSF